MQALIINSNTEAAKQLSNYLHREQLVVSVAKSIDGAHKYANSNKPPQLVLIDLSTYSEASAAYLKTVKVSDNEKWTPVIAILKDGEENTVNEALNLGIDDYILDTTSEIEIRSKVKLLSSLYKKMTAVSNQNALLKKQVTTDPLTQLPNRAAALEYTEKMVDQSVRYGQHLSLVSVAIDTLASYEEAFGYEAAQSCVSMIAAAAENTLNRPLDFIGRIDETHFIAVLPDTNTEGANLVAANIQRAVEALNILRKKGSTPKTMTVTTDVSSALGGEIDSLDQFVLQTKIPVIQPDQKQSEPTCLSNISNITFGQSIGECLSDAIVVTPTLTLQAG